MYKKIFLTLLISVAGFASSNNQSASGTGTPCCLKTELASRVHDRAIYGQPRFVGYTETSPGKYNLQFEFPVVGEENRRQFDFEYTVGRFVLNCRTADDSETQVIKGYCEMAAHPGCCIAALLTLLRYIEPAAPLICPNENILADFFNKTPQIGSRYCALYIEPKGDEWKDFFTVVPYADDSQATQPTDASQAGTSNQAGTPNIDNQ